VAQGLIALIVALVSAVAGGVLWRRGNGRLRAVEGGPQPVVAVEPPADQVGNGLWLDAEALGQALGERATLVQFSSAFCAPCRATRRILTEVTGLLEGVTYVEVDAESRLDLVRALHVLRTPTVLVVDSAGRIVKRAAGQPRKVDVIAALGPVIDSGIAHISGRE
jgi:thiol-disulfide isomerase/thioredoxin